MATALKPLNRIKLFFQGLSGSFDEEYDDETGYDKEELEELNKMSAENISKIESKHGAPVINVDEEKDKDRLGIKKPTILKRTQSNSEQNRVEQPEQGREDR